MEHALSHSVWNTGADTTGYLAVFTCRTHTSIASATVARRRGLYLAEAEI